MIYSGYCIVFYPDKKRDLFKKEGIQIHKKILLLYEHKYVIGKIKKLILTKYGLWVEFEILNLFIINKIKNSFLNYLSVGYINLKSSYYNSIRYIEKILLLEISIVKYPVQNLTKFYPSERTSL